MNHQNSIRRKIIDTAFQCGKGCHIGSALSIVDILTVLFDGIKLPEDELILSKGHAALAWYAAMNEFGMISDEKLSTFEESGGELTVLAIKNPNLLFRCSTGSLGQGISVAVGIGIAMKRKHIQGKVYVIVGDGECNEGIVWEAAQLAGHHKLNNLCVLVDHNGYQSDGNSMNVINLANMADMWKSFGFHAVEVDGHNVDEIRDALNNNLSEKLPSVVVCKTVKGYGISFMENSADWHYNRLTNEKYKAAIAELGDKYAG